MHDALAQPVPRSVRAATLRGCDRTLHSRPLPVSSFQYDAKLLRELLEVLVGVRVVVRAADIEPVAVERSHTNSRAVLQPVEHQGVEAVCLTLLEALDNPTGDAIYAHAHIEGVDRLLDKCLEVESVVVLENSEVDIHLAPEGGYGDVAAACLMISEKSLEIEVAENVAVHYKEILREVVDQCERADRAQWLIFERVVDSDVPP